MYRSYDNQRVTPCDVDDTIIRHSKDNKEYKDGRINVKCPYTGTDYYFEPIHCHIDFIKQQKGRGDLVIVWSARGGPWARAVVDALGLQNEVDLVFGKMGDYVDDRDISGWAGHRIDLRGIE